VAVACHIRATRVAMGMTKLICQRVPAASTMARRKRTPQGPTGWPPAPSPYVSHSSQPQFFPLQPIRASLTKPPKSVNTCACQSMFSTFSTPVKYTNRSSLQSSLQRLRKIPLLWRRLLGAVNLDNLFRHMQNPDINPTARIEFQKMLNKMGRLEPDTKIDSAGTGPQVVINITRAKDQEDSITIEGQAVEDGA